MVKELSKEGKKYYQCEECKLIYQNREIAEKCEDWCKKHNSCNIQITKYAINKKENMER